MNYRVILLSVVLIFSNIVFANSEYHICTNTRLVKKTQHVPYTVTTWREIRKPCFSIKLFCADYVRVYYTKYYITTISSTESYEDCCRGYAWLDNKKEKCIPICTNPCVRGICTAPGTCTCELGYVKIASSQSVCMLNCTESCIGGTCTESNVCQCLPHATLMSNATHNICKCDTGFQMMDTEACLPVCQPACINGTCEAPGKCTCLPGFNASDVWNECRPACVEVCDGNCTTDGKCMNKNGSNSDSMSMQNTRLVVNANIDNTNYWTSIGIGLGLTAVIVISGTYFLYKKKICKRTPNVNKDSDEYIVTNSIYGWNT